MHEHNQNLHVGPRGLLATLRLRFWIVDGQRTISSLLRKCLVCFKVKPTILHELMGDLPSQRVTPARPFFKCGINFAGPFIIKISQNVTGKAYFSVFVCFATKAVHLEVVSALSTPAFLNALKRCIARRGRSEQIFTDNGTNFVGANNELKAIYESLSTSEAHNEIGTFLASKTIKWSFIPPLTPHFGGLWEAAVKSAKTHLTKVIGLSSLTFEELSTVAAEIETVLNSRPLCPLSNDLNDFEPLTPGHFIIGEPLIALPEPNYKDIPKNRTTRYGLLIQMKERFWDRWSKVYLTQLQQRSKWKRILLDQLKPGLLVLLKEDNTSPLMWPAW